MNIHAQLHSPPSGWFKSSASNPAQDCVEVRFDGDLVHVRDSKDQAAGPVITVPAQHWPGFLAEVLGHVEAGSNRAVRIAYLADDGVRLHALDGGIVLSFTGSEWDAFTAGVAGGEFTHSHHRSEAPGRA